MKRSVLSFIFLAPVLADEKIPQPEVKPEPQVIQGHVFAWPFVEVEKMQPRGGMTRGSEVVLDREPASQWFTLKKQGLTKRERDRQAILALAGDFRVSFDFVEIMGFAEDYTPPRPYFSWGTEHVQVIESRADFVSLQHTLVMYFEDPETQKTETMTMKHWRQDWTYEDKSMHVYRGNGTWENRTVRLPKGRWSQAVYQVDDSPRYEVTGRWTHGAGLHIWKSDAVIRPLPRREFSVREDYNMLNGTHEITLTPNGWVHTQQNKKVSLPKDGFRKIVGKEYGINRYERISSPSLAPAAEEWKKVGPYWAEVREKWAEVYQNHKRFTLLEKVDNKKLWQHHFGFAAKILKNGYHAEEGRQHARSTIEKFLSSTEKSATNRY
ncbi:MAG: DUF6607 family protein [Akkermansiaceae bacterium]